MKKNIIIWIIFFFVTFLMKIYVNKIYGGFYSASRAYSWEQIYNDLPFSLFYSILGGFAGVIALKLDKKDRDNN